MSGLHMAREVWGRRHLAITDFSYLSVIKTLKIAELKHIYISLISVARIMEIKRKCKNNRTLVDKTLFSFVSLCKTVVSDNKLPTSHHSFIVGCPNSCSFPVLNWLENYPSTVRGKLHVRYALLLLYSTISATCWYYTAQTSKCRKSPRYCEY